MGEINSQTKVFIDFGATAGGSGGGALLLKRVKSVKVKDERGVEIVKAVGVKGGAGYRRKEGGGTITLEVYREDIPEIAWRAVRDDKKIFTWTMQDENDGPRENFYQCTVSTVDRSSDDEGSHMDEIELKFLSSEES